jgi:mono/diheme cytochrome c family protein
MLARSSLVGIATLLVLIGCAAGALWALTAQMSASSPTPQMLALPPADQHADAAPESTRATFEHMCGTCHTLRAAHATGLFGPDLDAVRPSAARVRQMIRTGTSDSIMQANLLRGREARAMAAYVARVAGRR